MSDSETPIDPSWSTRPFHRGSSETPTEGELVFERLSSALLELFDQSNLLVSFFAKPKPDDPDEDLAYLARLFTFLYT